MTNASIRSRIPAGSDDSLRCVTAFMRRELERRQLSGEAGRIDRVTEWGGGAFGYAYDANGDLIAITEANGRINRFAYDGLRRLIAVQQGAEESKRYGYDAHDRLAEIVEQGIVTRYRYDLQGRIARIEHGQDDVSVYRYDAAGRTVMARTSQTTTCWQYDEAGRTTLIEQSIGGVTLVAQLQYDDAGRLATMTLPGNDRPIRYAWDSRGRPQTLSLDQAPLARFRFDDANKGTHTDLANGVTVENVASLGDGRPAQQRVRRSHALLLERTLVYNEVGEIINDGERGFLYDPLGRLIGVQEKSTGAVTLLRYDELDNLVARVDRDGIQCLTYAADCRLVSTTNGAGETTRFTHDRAGRLTQKVGTETAWCYRYDDAGLLREVRSNSEIIASFLYDHKGRLVLADVGGRVERYLYGAADELLAVTDGNGHPLRLLVRTPMGVLAEVHGAIGEGELYFRHDDERGTTRLITDRAGAVVAQMEWDPFGLPIIDPLGAGPAAVHPAAAFMGRTWVPEIGLYYFGARWYDPATARFLTPDSYTGAPDDERLLNPLRPSREQAAARGQILNEWLKQPRVRNPFAFCGNDPIGRVDPNGHWSFGGVLLMLLGAIWTLPNTLFGILVEITCLVGEVIRWLVWLFSFGHVSWQTPGFDAAASGNLNAFALVFTGGWLGSFSNLLGITFGNVFFVYKEWETSPHITSLPDPIYPAAYNGSVSIPRDHMLYEHELRHTNQYGWLGPFFHLGLPIFGFYEWDVIINGYEDAWTERDARAHAEP